MCKKCVKMMSKNDHQNHVSLCGFEPQLTNLEFIVYPPKLKNSCKKCHKLPQVAKITKSY